MLTRCSAEESTIILSPPARDQQSYRHEAFLWHDAEAFVAGLLPFVEEGLELGEPVMVAMIDEHASWLRDALGSQADEVRFVDMRVLGRNPATIIPGWQHFLDAEGADSRPTRGIGEPIWAGRRSEEVLECQLHEALLNVAVDPKVPFWLICPYDVGHLDAAVIDEAHRSHPAIIETNSYQGSPRYRGRAHVDEMLAAPLDRPPGRPVQIPFSARNLSRLVSFVKLEGHVAGLSPEQAADLASATHRLASSSLARGADSGIIRIWSHGQAVVCDVIDDTFVDDPLAGRRAPYQDDSDGLWSANQLCDLVQLRSTPDGTTVRVHAWRRPESSESSLTQWRSIPSMGSQVGMGGSSSAGR
ncbi:MAG TPA: MEDS domain-containing protein [Propionibacteriaceae bacterium]|nr:MEDS domain-containing protein [Propionibacteriaceae bacterium]